MPDDEGNVNQQDWLEALGWDEPAPEPVSQAPVDPEITSAPAPAPIPAPEPVTTPVPTAPAPNPVEQQQAALRDQQAQLTLTQQQTLYRDQLVKDHNVAPSVADMAAGQWAQAQWATYQQGVVTQQANNLAKSAKITELAAKHGVDPVLLQSYDNPTAMEAAASQYGEIAKLKAQTPAQPKAPVQEFTEGAASPAASSGRQALAYVRGDPGSTLNREQFIQVHGFDPTGA